MSVANLLTDNNKSYQLISANSLSLQKSTNTFDFNTGGPFLLDGNYQGIVIFNNFPALASLGDTQTQFALTGMPSDVLIFLQLGPFASFENSKITLDIQDVSDSLFTVEYKNNSSQGHSGSQLSFMFQIIR